MTRPEGRDPFEPGPPWGPVAPPPQAYPGRRPLPQPVATAQERVVRGSRRAVLVVAVLALFAAFVVGSSAYLALNTIHVVSIDPLGQALGSIALFVVTSIVAFAVFVASMVVLIRRRPRLLAGLTALAAAVLPALAVVIAVPFGAHAVLRHAAVDLAVNGKAVAGTADAVLDALHVEPGPLRDVLRAVGGS